MVLTSGTIAVGEEEVPGFGERVVLPGRKTDRLLWTAGKTES